MHGRLPGSSCHAGLKSNFIGGTGGFEIDLTRAPFGFGPPALTNLRWPLLPIRLFSPHSDDGLAIVAVLFGLGLVTAHGGTSVTQSLRSTPDGDT
jgi:hypothetical protein